MRKDSYFRLIDSTWISCIDPEGSLPWISASYRESYACVFVRTRTRRLRTRPREIHAFVCLYGVYNLSGSCYTSRKIS